MAKQQYRIRNWKDCNQFLIQSGSLPFWFDDKSINNWSAVLNFKQGRLPIYSEIAIACALMMSSVFHCSLRATQGVVSSLIKLAGLPLLTLRYTTTDVEVI